MSMPSPSVRSVLMMTTRIPANMSITDNVRLMATVRESCQSCARQMNSEDTSSSSTKYVPAARPDSSMKSLSNTKCRIARPSPVRKTARQSAPLENASNVYVMKYLDTPHRVTSMVKPENPVIKPIWGLSFKADVSVLPTMHRKMRSTSSSN